MLGSRCVTWWWRAPLECDLVKRTYQRKQQANNRMEFADFSAHFGENQNPPLFHGAGWLLSVACLFLWQGFFQKVCRQWIPSAPKICISRIFEVLVCCYYSFDQFLSLNLCLIGSSWHLQPNVIRYDDMTKLISMHSTFPSELIFFWNQALFWLLQGFSPFSLGGPLSQHLRSQARQEACHRLEPRGALRASEMPPKTGRW